VANNGGITFFVFMIYLTLDQTQEAPQFSVPVGLFILHLGNSNVTQVKFSLI